MFMLVVVGWSFSETEFSLGTISISKKLEFTNIEKGSMGHRERRFEVQARTTRTSKHKTTRDFLSAHKSTTTATTEQQHQQTILS